MKISYRREFKHNYLIIDPEELTWQGYESQMMSRNSIEGVLRFQLRQMDSGVRFYYEITSRQPLSRILENRNIQAEEIRRLVIGIFGVLERAERYLLMEERILLEPQYLYVDPDTFRVWLCFVPGIERNFPEDFSKLLEYLLGSVDHQDKESVVLAYGLYQETRKENYGMEDLGRLLQQGKTNDKEKKKDDISGQEISDEPDVYKQYEETGKKRLNISGNQRKNPDKRQREESYLSTKEQEKTPGKRASWKQKWKDWSGGYFLRNSKEKDLPIRPPWEMMFQDSEEEERDFGKGGKLWQREIIDMDDEQKKDTPSAGPGTQLLADFSDNKRQRILRALNPKEQDIPILYYPFVIGKQESLVDFQLERDTVSRLHLRIDQDGDTYRRI